MKLGNQLYYTEFSDESFTDPKAICAEWIDDIVKAKRISLVLSILVSVINKVF